MNFEQCLAIIFKLEGFESDDPADPGGRTRYGITKATYTKWLGRAPTERDWEHLSRQVASGIYNVFYWAPAWCENLPRPLRLVVFDCAVNQGVDRAKRWLQEAVGATPDGIIGPRTLAKAKSAVRSGDGLGVIVEISARRTVHWSGLINLIKFRFGWFRRGYRVACECARLIER